MLSLLSTTKQNAFCILSSTTSIESIRAKFDELSIFVQELRETGFEFSAICVQESF